MFRVAKKNPLLDFHQAGSSIVVTIERIYTKKTSNQNFDIYSVADDDSNLIQCDLEIYISIREHAKLHISIF